MSIITNNTKTPSSSSLLLFSIEQWEMVRRLKSSGLNKDQLCQAYDDLERIERDLSCLLKQQQQQQQQQLQSNTNNNHNNNNNNELAKNFHLLLARTMASLNNSNRNVHSSSSNNDLDVKELDDFRSKSEHAIHYEISQFAYKHDLKQSQIARQAGVNQAYVSKFLRGDFVDLSENANNINNEIGNKLQQQEHNDNVINIINNGLEQPKRTRFSFKTEHLLILEKAFIENPYPDPKRREELARRCNHIIGCSSNSSSSSETFTTNNKVTEQIVTHWFQNKRKINRKLNNSKNDLNHSRQIVSPNSNTNNESSSTTSSIDLDEYDQEQEVDEAQVAAYKAIMSRMTSKTNTEK